MEFSKWFCLNKRESFTIDPKINSDDSKFYFGREDFKKRIIAQLRRSFVEPGAPKMIVYGSFGSGKTQTLYHLDHYLKHNGNIVTKLKIKTVHLDLEMRRKSEYNDWHLQLMENLGKEPVTEWVDGLFNKSNNLDADLKAIFKDNNRAEAVKNLRVGGDTGFLAWRWLCGQRLSNNDLERLRVTRNLGDIGAGDMVDTLVGLGHLAEKNGEKIIFFMDEGEQFTNVKTSDAIESLHDYLRRLSEPSNSTIGFVIGYYALTTDQMPELVNRSDIMTRIGANNYIEVPPFPSIDDVQIFLKQLLSELVDKNEADKKIDEESLSVGIETYPFTLDAFEMLCEFASQDPVKSLPRNLIKSVNECAISAWDEKKKVIDDSIVNEIAPLIFG